MQSSAKKFIATKIQELKKEYLYAFTKKPRRILFDHLPKCGGSTLNTYLEANYPKRKTFSTLGGTPRISVDAFQKLSQDTR